MTRHQATFSLTSTLAAPAPGSLPDGHLARINTLQAARGKDILTAEQLVVRPIRLFGNKLTGYFTRVPDGDLKILADQINASGGPMLSAHLTNTTPIGSFYSAQVVEGDFTATPDLGEPQQALWLDTWVYWLNDDEGQRLARLIDSGVINEASIGYWYDQALCSITGASYWNSPYYAGNEYDVVDPETGNAVRKLCFIWTTGNIEFVEGSLVYRGAYPGTKVGGSGTPLAVAAVAAAPTGLHAPAPQTRFQLAASKDLQAVFEKAPATHGEGKPTQPPSTADQKGEESLKLNLKLPDGSVKEIEHTDTQATLDQQVSAALARGQQQQLEKSAAALGIEPKDATETSLTTLAAQASDGRQYRADLLDKLSALTLATLSNDEQGRKVAERQKKAFGAMPVEDIREEVERLEAVRDAALPGGRLSDDRPAPVDGKAPAKPDFDSV